MSTGLALHRSLVPQQWRGLDNGGVVINKARSLERRSHEGTGGQKYSEEQGWPMASMLCGLHFPGMWKARSFAFHRGLVAE
jgi:hypothetical protein